MNAALRTQRERGKPRGPPHRLSCSLIYGNVAIRHTFRIRRAHAAEEGTHGKVPALDPVIEPRVEREIFLVRLERFDGLRQLVIRACFRGEERRRIKAEQVADAHHPHRTLRIHGFACERGDGCVLSKETTTE